MTQGGWPWLAGFPYRWLVRVPLWALLATTPLMFLGAGKASPVYGVALSLLLLVLLLSQLFELPFALYVCARSRALPPRAAFALARSGVQLAFVGWFANRIFSDLT
jgi:hypothetical protein